MSKHRKSWSETEKTTITNYYREHGAASASRQFNVATSVIYRWVNQEKLATEKPDTGGSFYKHEYHRLLVENQSLKEIVAEKELAIRIKEALLKKSQSQTKND
jgi:transposase-like protein